MVPALRVQERHERREGVRADAASIRGFSTTLLEIVETEEQLRKHAADVGSADAGTVADGEAAGLFRPAARDASSAATEMEVRSERLRAAAFARRSRRVDTCAAEFEAYTPYYYSTYEDEDEVPPKQPGKQADHDPRRRAEPHRAGDRVRLLLLPRQLRAARSWASSRSWSTRTRRR